MASACPELHSKKACWACAVTEIGQQYTAGRADDSSRVSDRSSWCINPTTVRSLWRSQLASLTGIAFVCEAVVAADRGMAGDSAVAPDPPSFMAAAPTLIRSVLHIPLLLLCALLLVAVLRAAVTGKPRKPLKLVSTDPAQQLKYARVLSAAIKCKTISRDPEQVKAGKVEPVDWAQFAALHSLLRATFPAVFKQLEVHTLGGDPESKYSLAIQWKGSDPTLQPWLLCAHLDVVSAEGQQWVEGVDPFGGTIAEEPVAGVGNAGESTVWGRGAIDDKNNLVAQLGAVEELLLLGYIPRRTLWLAYGHDEEVGGFEGARAIGQVGATTTKKELLHVRVSGRLAAWGDSGWPAECLLSGRLAECLAGSPQLILPHLPSSRPAATHQATPVQDLPAHSGNSKPPPAARCHLAALRVVISSSGGGGCGSPSCWTRARWSSRGPCQGWRTWLSG